MSRDGGLCLTALLVEPSDLRLGLLQVAYGPPPGTILERDDLGVRGHYAPDRLPTAPVGEVCDQLVRLVPARRLDNGAARPPGLLGGRLLAAHLSVGPDPIRTLQHELRALFVLRVQVPDHPAAVRRGGRDLHVEPLPVP